MREELPFMGERVRLIGERGTDRIGERGTALYGGRGLELP